MPTRTSLKNTQFLAYKPAERPIVWAGKDRGIWFKEAINQTFLIYNSAWVISLINSVWVVYATSSLPNMDQAGTDFSEMSSHQPVLITSFLPNGDWNGWSKLHQEKLNKTLRTSREGRKLDPSWNDTSRRRQDVIWLLSGNSTSPIFRALICKLICGWQRQAWVWEWILDVIWCLTPSSFADWSLIGNEGAAFPLWGRQGRWQLEHMDMENESRYDVLTGTARSTHSNHKLHFT